jgi:hypothetical protein
LKKHIELTKGAVAIVDDDDYEELSKYKWFLHKDGYAVRNIRLGVNKRTAEMMHRVIMKTPKGLEVDHIDGNKLNNCKANLRNCTHKQNMGNLKKRSNGKSKYKGVSRVTGSNKWQSYVLHQGETIYFGVYSSEKDAASVYNDWAIKTFGEFASLNDIGEHEVLEKNPKRNIRTSVHKNIWWNKINKTWRVNINNKHYGTFHDLESAISKRDQILSALQ